LDWFDCVSREVRGVLVGWRLEALNGSKIPESLRGDLHPLL
jgi:hypothetical protein